MPDIFLHIGIPKTGTTAIQRFFSQRRLILKSAGILYPVTMGRCGAHYELSSVFGFGPKTGQNLSKKKNILIREIRHSGCEKVIFSSENFVLPGDIEGLNRFFQAFDTKIVVYLRRHDKWWPSAYQQSVRMVAKPKWKRSFEEFIKFQKKHGARYWDYRRLLDRWASVFGKDNIIVRPFEFRQIGSNVIGDILKIIGASHLCKNLDCDAAKLQVNESISALSLLLIEEFQRANIPKSIRTKLIAHALQVKSSKGLDAICPPSILKQQIEENLEDYKYIARHYFGRRDGRLFYEDIPALEDSKSDEILLTRERLLEETIKALTGYDLNSL